MPYEIYFCVRCGMNFNPNEKLESCPKCGSVDLMREGDF